MIVCNGCGAHVSDRDARCRECGAPNPLAPQRVVPIPPDPARGGETGYRPAPPPHSPTTGGTKARPAIILGFIGSSLVVALLTAVTVAWMMGPKDVPETKAATGATPSATPQTTPARPSPTSTPTPTTTPAPSPTEPARAPISQSEVSSFLDGWQDAWESSDIGSYASYYADEFVGVNYSSQTGYRTMSRAEWLADKRQKFRRSDYFSIETGPKSISYEGDVAVVTFRQTFRSDSYSDSGTKTLRLRRDASGAPRIIREDFSPR